MSARAVALLAVAVACACSAFTAQEAKQDATCAAEWSGCLTLAKVAPGDVAAKKAIFVACRSQVDAQCLDAVLAPPPASAAPSATPSATVSAAPPAAIPAGSGGAGGR